MPKVNVIYPGVPFISASRQPTNGGYVTTKFGAYNTLDGGARNRIGDDYSEENYLTDYGLHPGADISGSADNNIYAINAGIVVFVGSSTTNGGNKVVIQHFYNGDVYYSMYFHLAEGSCSVNVGDMVYEGDQIARMGNSGTTLTHLHFEVRTQDGVGQNNSGIDFAFPGAPSQWWANSEAELSTNWVDISSRFGGYDENMPLAWRPE